MSAIAVQPLPTEARPENPAEASMIRRFKREAVVPGWLESRYNKMADDARYLSETAYADDDKQLRGVNILERVIDAKLAQIFPSDPWICVKPEAILGAQLMPPQWVQQQSALRKVVAQTNQKLIEKLYHEADGSAMFQGVAQDAFAMSVAYLKVTWQEDAGRDATGRTRNSDAQDQMDRLRRLASEFAAGEWDEADGRYLELMHLSEYAIAAAREAVFADDPRAGRLIALANAQPGQVVQPYMMPEPSVWRGVKIIPVEARNLRLDWDVVTKPELFYHGRHMTEITWMSRDEIVQEYKLSLEEGRMLGRSNRDMADDDNSAKASAESEDPEDTDLDATQRGDMVAVYERWDKANHRYYCWAAGLPRFLHTEIPEITSRYFFPYVQVMFSRQVRRYHPKSDVAKGRKMQEQINQKLTDDDEARLARYPRYLIDDSVSDEDAAAIERCDPHKTVRVRGAEDVAKKIHAVMGTTYEPGIYDVNEDIRLVELQIGAPMQSLGMVNQARFATEAKNANDHMLAQSGKSGDILLAAIRTACIMIGDYANAAMPAENVKRLVGEGAVWPHYNREDLWRSMRLTVEAGGSNKAARRQNVENWSVAAKAITEILQTKLLAMQAGYNFNVEGMIANVFAELDIRDPVEDILQTLAEAGMLPNGAPGMLGMQQPGMMSPVMPS